MRAIFALLLFVHPGSAADTGGTNSTPQTKLEAFSARRGSVVVWGHTKIGSFATVGKGITVEIREFREVSSRARTSGIRVEIQEGGGRFSRTVASFVDLDEIDSLLAGIDYIAKLTKEVTPLDDFQADFKTNGGLIVTTFSSHGGVGGVLASITCGRFGSIDIIISIDELKKFRGFIEEAKKKLQSLK